MKVWLRMFQLSIWRPKCYNHHVQDNKQFHSVCKHQAFIPREETEANPPVILCFRIIGLYVGFVWLVGKFVRLFFTSISYRIMFDEMPNVDKVLKLCLDIFMVRESKELALEEDLFAKLMFLYRSPQTLIKWTKYKRQQRNKMTGGSFIIRLSLTLQ